MQKHELLVRGIHGGVLITLPVLPWYQQRDLLVSRIQTQERFFKGGRIALDVGSTDWSEEQLQKLLRDLSDEGVCLWTILSSSPLTIEAAKFHGFPTSLPDPNRGKEEAKTGQDEIRPGFDLLNRSLEAGEEYHHEGNLLMIGDVVSGASLTVKGSLILWGGLAGAVSIGTEDPTANLMFLRFEKGTAQLCGMAVEIPQKESKNFAFEVSMEEGVIQVKSNKSGGFRLL